MACSLERPGVGAEPWGAAMDPASTGGAPDQRSWEILSIKHGDFAIFYNTFSIYWENMEFNDTFIGIYWAYNDNI